MYQIVVPNVQSSKVKTPGCGISVSAMFNLIYLIRPFFEELVYVLPKTKFKMKSYMMLTKWESKQEFLLKRFFLFLQTNLLSFSIYIFLTLQGLIV